MCAVDAGWRKLQHRLVGVHVGRVLGMGLCAQRGNQHAPPWMCGHSARVFFAHWEVRPFGGSQRCIANVRAAAALKVVASAGSPPGAPLFRNRVRPIVRPPLGPSQHQRRAPPLTHLQVIGHAQRHALVTKERHQGAA